MGQTTGCDAATHHETLVVVEKEETEAKHLYRPLPRIYENINLESGYSNI